jgi:hypothetical protein
MMVLKVGVFMMILIGWYYDGIESRSVYDDIDRVVL